MPNEDDVVLRMEALSKNIVAMQMTIAQLQAEVQIINLMTKLLTESE